MRIAGADLTALIAGIVGRDLEPRKATFAAFRDAHGDVIDQGLAIYFPGARVVYGRKRARAARPREPRGASPVARSLRRAWRKVGSTWRIHQARVPEWPHRPGAGRGRGRSHRCGNGDGGARCGAQLVRRVLARSATHRRCTDRPAHVHRGDARLSRGGDRIPGDRRRARTARGDPGRAQRVAGARPRWRASAGRTDGRAGRAPQRRQVEPAECVGARRSGNRHADTRDDARSRWNGRSRSPVFR